MYHQPKLAFADKDLYGDWWEYLFLASPEPDITERVRKVKEDFFNVYEYRMAIETWPHVTLASFMARGEIEDNVVQSIRQACRRHQPFTVNLQGFDWFRNLRRHTLFITIQEHQPFLGIAASLYVLDDCLYRNGCPRAQLVDHPHLTIARGLPSFIYEEAIEDYCNRDFNDQLFVNKLVLCKRRHQKDKCKHVSSLFLSAN